MYLKRIEAYGFKSFANRVSIEFDLGMNGIVGPNGSGKSNVVDAVRWVLGEQSAKMLRGGSMQDVIFKGSASKKQLGFSEVTLVLDNSDKTLPVAFDEVSVTRRLYRSGESNYVLNKQKVRLQDITNLFMDSGIGKESFSIIGQGKIDEILNSKPVERRAIFEETAGVLKYKTRKEQTLRRLAKTHENLVRVVDVIKELEMQLKPLEKQSEQATTFLEFKQELSSLEISLLAFEVQSLMAEHTELHAENNQLTVEIVQTTVQIEQTIQALEEMENSVKQKEHTIHHSQEKLVLITQESESAKGAHKVQLQKREHFETMIQQTAADIAELLLKIESVAALESKSSALNFDNKLAQAKTEEVSLRNKMEQFVQEITNMQQSYQQETNKLQAVRTRLETLTEIDSSQQNLFQGVREVIKASKGQRIAGIHGTVLDLIEVQADYVKAIEVSFANALQFIVTTTQQDAEAAIRYLKQNRLGKATFLPLNVMKGSKLVPEQIQRVASLPGYIGIASDLVSNAPEYQLIIFNLLGQTIVAEDLASANTIARTLNFSSRIVTLQGEVVHRGGSLTGGEGKHERAGLLLQKQQMKDLQVEEVTLTGQVTTLQQKLSRRMLETKDAETVLQDAQNQVRTIQQQQELFASKLAQMLTQKDDLQIQVVNLTARKDGYSQELTTLLSASENLFASTTAYDEQKEQILAEINALRTERYKQEQKMQDLRNAQKAAEQTERGLSQKLQKNELKQNTAEIKVNEKISRLQDTYGQTFESVKNIEMLAPYQEVEVRVKELRTAIDRMGMVNLGAIEEYERVSERFEYLTDQKLDLDEAEENLLEIIQEMDVEMEERFARTFSQIQEHFAFTFRQMFGGGHAELRLEDQGDYLTSGIEIFTQPPGKKIQNLSLLSGGERALTAIALLFAILKTKPVPFCILDEVEAALDEANVERFAKYVKQFSEDTQFIVVTHRKGTMEMADVLYGVTMEEAGISKILSVRLQDADKYLDV